MTSHLTKLLLSGLITWTFTTPCGWSATILPASLEDLAALATDVVLAECQDTHAEWDAARRDAVTTNTFRIQEVWKGNRGAGGTLVLRQAGVGSVDGITSDIAGAPRFRASQQYVLFLWEQEDGALVVLGQSFGVFDVAPPAGAAKDKDAHVTAHGAVLQSQPVASGTLPAPTLGIRGIGLKAFQSRVAAAVGRAESRGQSGRAYLPAFLAKQHTEALENGAGRGH